MRACREALRPEPWASQAKQMRYLKYIVLLGILAFVCAGTSQAQVRVGIGFGVGPVYGPVYGPAPVCAYGYYDYYPYACAPYGYYGPDWFTGGVFIGAGPWFHGWYGHGWRGDWDHDGWRDRGFHRGWDHNGWRGRGWDHDGWRGHDGDRGREFHGDRGFHGGGEFHGDRGFHGGGSHGGGG